MANITAGVTGNITAISEDGLDITVDGTVASTDVGRIIMLTNNTSHPGRYRRITVANSLEGIYTIDSPFGTSVFRNLPSTAANSTNNATNELGAAVNDTYVISRTLAEEAATNADLEEVADTNNYFRTTGTITFLANCLIYDEDCTLELDWQDHFRYSSSNGSVKTAGLILGRQNFGPNDTDTDTGGWTSNSCNFIETSTSFISGTYDDPIAFHMNGGFWRSTAGTSDNGVFYRFNDGQDQSFRFWNVNITGKFGGRVAGDYSVFYGNRSNNNDSGFAILNPLRMAVFQDNSVKGGIQALYSFPHTAGSTTVLATEIDDIQTRILRLHGNNTSTNNNSVSTIANWDFDAIDRSTTAGADLIAVESHGTRTTVHDWVKDYEITVTTADGDEMDRLGEIIFEDTEGTQTTDSDDSLGNFPSQRLIAYKNTVANTNTNVSTLASGTTYTPYNWAIKYRGHNLITGNTDLRAPFGPIQLTRPAIVDANVTDTVANIDALTEIETVNEMYDYADKFKHENMSMPTVTTQLFTLSGDSVVVTDSTYDVTCDSSASSVFSWNADDEVLTVKSKASGYTGGIECATFTTDTEILGPVNASTITFSQTLTSGQTIITTGTGDEVRGTVTLPAGTYVIENADVSNLSINRNAGDTDDVIIRLSGTTGTPTTGTGVSLEIRLILTVEGATAGAFTLFDKDADTETSIHHVSGATATITGTDVSELGNDSEVRIVWSGAVGGTGVGWNPIIKDTELSFGDNNITLTATSDDFSTTEAPSGASITLADSDLNITPQTVVLDITLSNFVGSITESSGESTFWGFADTEVGVSASANTDTAWVQFDFTSPNDASNLSQLISVINAMDVDDSADNSSTLSSPSISSVDSDTFRFNFSGTRPSGSPTSGLRYFYISGLSDDSDGQDTVDVSISYDGTVLGSGTMNLNNRDSSTNVVTFIDLGEDIFDAVSTMGPAVIGTVTGASASLSDTQTSNFIHRNLKGTEEFNIVVSKTNDTGILTSLGSASYSEANSGNIKFRSGENLTQNFGHIGEVNGAAVSNFNLNRTIDATIGGSDTELVYQVNIPSGPAAFDLPGTVAAVATDVETRVDNAFNDRHLTPANVENLGRLKPVIT